MSLDEMDVIWNEVKKKGLQFDIFLDLKKDEGMLLFIIEF